MRMPIQMIPVIKIFLGVFASLRYSSIFSLRCVLLYLVCLWCVASEMVAKDSGLRNSDFGLCTREWSRYEVITRAGKQGKKQKHLEAFLPRTLGWGQGRAKHPCPFRHLWKRFAQTQIPDLLSRSLHTKITVQYQTTSGPSTERSSAY